MSHKFSYSKAYSIYGASMGRREERLGDTELPARFRIERVPARDGGDYDPGGAYWGNLNGNPLYVCWTYHETEHGPEYATHFVRARSREHVKEHVRKLYPNARFYR